MNLLVVGLNHETAPVQVREKFAFEGSKLKDGVEKLRALPCVQEAIVVSTCNRVEMYTAVTDPSGAPGEIKAFLSDFHGLEGEMLEGSLYFHSGRDAVRHVFRVASGLDSMVLGEPQIFGQIKDAFDFSLQNKATGVLLNKLMKKTISVAKRVRTETGIAKYAVSISFTAVELAKKIFSELRDKSVLLLGAGEMAELAATHLLNNGVREIVVSNRTHGRAVELAAGFGGRTVKFEDFPSEMVHTDIVICSTGAPEYVVTKEQMHSVMKKRKQEQVFIIDISVPRNVDPEINDMDNVYLYSVDDLRDVVDTNLNERRKEAQKAEAIVEEEIESLLHWQASLKSVPTILALREWAEEVKQSELEKLLKKTKGLGPKEQEEVQRMASAIVNKLIHPPTAALKEDAENMDTLIAAIKRLYGLNGD